MGETSWRPVACMRMMHFGQVCNGQCCDAARAVFSEQCQQWSANQPTCGGMMPPTTTRTCSMPAWRSSSNRAGTRDLQTKSHTAQQHMFSVVESDDCSHAAKIQLKPVDMLRPPAQLAQPSAGPCGTTVQPDIFGRIHPRQACTAVLHATLVLNPATWC